MQKILIVDDEPIARNSVKYIIEKNIPELEIVGLCASGKEAIAKNYEFRPDIIIMDNTITVLSIIILSSR